MFDREKIKLTPVEATAYWWINVIRYRIKEIVKYGYQDKKEIKFVEIFYYFTEIDWRNIYLELVKYISEDVKNYIPKRSSEPYNQDTDVNSHNRLNEMLSKIVKKKIPDIRLASKNEKDSVIYTADMYASVWYKSCGESKLQEDYEPSYILTGEKESLDFYNLLVATIVVLAGEDKHCEYRSVSILREKFCEEYVRLSGFKEKIEDVIEKFNYFFNQANDREIILGRFHSEEYFPNFCDIDCVGLEPYMELANHYAQVILEGTRTVDEGVSSRSLKKEKDN